ncbi:MAG: Flagellum-specific ATP synthase [Phycisphaerae bacterium]|nr:Flagellum-specific ATP synthase [Phycisphaerae bacterium]
MALYDRQFDSLRRIQPMGMTGRLQSVTGLIASAEGLSCPVGARCRIRTATGGDMPAEVVGFSDRGTLVMPLGETTGLGRGDRISLESTVWQVPVGPALLGRVVDAFARPIDGKGPLATVDHQPIAREPLGPMQRERVTEPIGTGVRCIDALMTVGQGQRMGIFAGPGVGKSVLLGMIARYTSADVVVVGLVGERGREVKDFLAKDLGDEGLAHSVVVVSTSDAPPLTRLRAGLTATAVAEYFRDQGLNVLLLMDSLTRMATAQRQIGLAAGEPPATRGYPPSVFSMMPTLLERAGRTASGSITGFYTVLVEGDDMTEPVTDHVRSILDGHLSLSRRLANRGHYPAVDVTDSISRLAVDLVDDEHTQAARVSARMVAEFNEIEDLVNIGAYVAGSNPHQDVAVQMRDEVNAFLCQRIEEPVRFAQAKVALLGLHRRIQQEYAKRGIKA